MRTAFNDSWVFLQGFDPSYAHEVIEGEPVSLPHNAVELPFSYFDETATSAPSPTRRCSAADPDLAGARGEPRLRRRHGRQRGLSQRREDRRAQDGYTPFEARLTGKLRDGRQPADGQDRRQREPGDPALRRPHRLSHLCRHLSRRLAQGHGTGLDRQRQDRDARGAEAAEIGAGPRRARQSAGARAHRHAGRRSFATRRARGIATASSTVTGAEVALGFDELERDRALGHRQPRRSIPSS